jgi:hypothetical protein
MSIILYKNVLKMFARLLDNPIIVIDNELLNNVIALEYFIKNI